MTFETVDDLRTWLEEEEPEAEEAEQALEDERDGDDRTTAKMALNEYLSGLPDEEQEEVDDDGKVDFVVMRPYAGHQRGEKLRLDPGDPQTVAYRSDGRIQRR